MVSTKQFIGLDNYIGLFTDKDFIKALGNTVFYVLFMMIFCFVMPYFFSFVLGQLVKKGQQFYRAIMFFPSLLSLAVAATVFRWIFNAVNGPATLLLNMMEMEAPKWLAQSGWVIFVLSLVTGWRCFGYNLVIFLAAIIEIPKDLIEAAKLENASNWTIFWKIVIPLTSSTALYVFVVSFVVQLMLLRVRDENAAQEQHVLEKRWNRDENAFQWEKLRTALADKPEAALLAKKIGEEIRYSDPMSSELLFGLEEEIVALTTEILKLAAEPGAAEGDIIRKEQRIQALVRERNDKCARLK